MHSFKALAIGLAVVAPSSARSTSGPYTDLENRDSSTSSGNPLLNWLGRLIRRQDGQSCVEDEYFNFAYNSTFGKDFCMAFMSYPNTTVTSDYTPAASATLSYYTTRTYTRGTTTVAGTTETVTVTASPNAKNKRDVGGADIAAVFSRFRSKNAAVDDGDDMVATVEEDDVLSASFSSACACQTYEGSTVTTTRTASAPTVTKLGFVNAFVPSTVSDDSTATTTVTVPESSNAVTVSVLPIPASSSAATVAEPSGPSSPGSTPVAPAFSCPEDNNSTVSQLIGNERFDYLILCDTDITDANFYNVLSYSSFSECAAACSVADREFDSPVCQGLSFYDTNESQNCFLKSTTKNTVSTTRADSAILLRIAVGISPDDPEGTNTETIPSVASTISMDPSDMSSSMSEIMGNSSTSIPLITPSPTKPGSYLVDSDGNTIYSTYESNGPTISGQTGFTTAYTTDGMWYESWYTAYSVAWAAETTVYAASETGYVAANSSESETTVQPGPNGGTITIITTNYTSYYESGYNVTEVTSTVTTADNGTEIASTAVTSYYSFETGSAGGIGGGSSGGASGNITSNSAGIITGSVSTSIYSTVTVISGSGGLAGSTGGGASGAISTTAPSLPSGNATSGGTAFSTGGANSGLITQSSSSSSGPIVVPTPFASNATSGGTAFSTGGGNSGFITSTGTSPSAITSNQTADGVAFSTGGGNSGFITTSSTSSPSSSTGTFSNTDRDRSGTLSTTRRSTTSSPPSQVTVSITTRLNSTFPTTTSANSTISVTATLPSGFTSAISSSNSTVTVSSNSTISSPAAVTTRTQTIPVGTGLTRYSFPFPSGTGYTFNPEIVTSTGGFFSNSEASRSGTAPPGTGFFPTGTAPTNSLPPFPTGTAPTGFLPTGTGSLPSSGFLPSFTNSINSRSGSSSSTSTGPSSCVTNFLGTTTIFSTATVYGCYENCPAQGGYGGGKPLSFGPPGGASPTRG